MSSLKLCPAWILTFKLEYLHKSHENRNKMSIALTDEQQTDLHSDYNYIIIGWFFTYLPYGTTALEELWPPSTEDFFI